MNITESQTEWHYTLADARDAKIVYCAPAWSGTCSAADRARLNSLLRRAKRLNYCTDDLPSIAELFSNADDDFFFIKSTPIATMWCSRIYLTIINYHISQESPSQ